MKDERSDLYIHSRKRKNEEPVTEIASKNIKEMKTLISQQEVDPSQRISGQIFYTKSNAYSQVISNEKRNGQIHGLGFGPSISRTRSSDKSLYYDFIERQMHDAHTIQTLQKKLLENERAFVEKMLEKEVERVEREKQFEQKFQALVEKEKQFEERIRMLEQLIPTMQMNGVPRDEVSPQESSCASNHD